MNWTDRFREPGTISLRKPPSLIVLAVEGDRSGNEAVQFAAESSLDTSRAGFVVEPLSRARFRDFNPYPRPEKRLQRQYEPPAAHSDEPCESSDHNHKFILCKHFRSADFDQYSVRNQMKSKPKIQSTPAKLVRLFQAALWPDNFFFGKTKEQGTADAGLSHEKPFYGLDDEVHGTVKSGCCMTRFTL